MSKKQGALSGVLGGIVFGILLRFSETAVFQVRILLNRLGGFPFPLYETLQHSPEAELIVKFVFIILVIPLFALIWTGVGILFAFLSTKQGWTRKISISVWIFWGFLLAFLVSNFSAVSYQCNVEVSICQAELIARTIWILFAGLIGGLVSELYAIRQISIRGSIELQS